MRSFFWEGYNGSKVNHLVKWDVVSKSQSNGSLGFGGLKNRNMTLSAKWGWKYVFEQDSLGAKL